MFGQKLWNIPAVFCCSLSVFMFEVGFCSMPAKAQMQVNSPSPTWIGLMNANIASEYVVTAMPMTKSGCPLIGYVRFFPGGTLKGVLITDMARSKAKFVSGKYSIANGKDIKFISDDPQVLLANMNGTIAFSSLTDPKNPPIDRLVLKTATPGCNAQTYKFSLTMDDE
ncbi:MAG: hypothetical protein NTY08_00415 [Proteobacteria bacterium]|nr:hypothetical protein [Pseudomonadota bacterium]